MKKKKSVYVSSRCTEEEKRLIQKRAEKQNQTESEYVLDCCMAGIERKRKKLRKAYADKIRMQEYLNRLNYVLEDNEDSMSKDVRYQIKDKIYEMEELINASFN